MSRTTGRVCAETAGPKPLASPPPRLVLQRLSLGLTIVPLGKRRPFALESLARILQSLGQQQELENTTFACRTKAWTYSLGDTV